nr:molybdenum ABC transporter ATP-binding protein [Litorivivens lipolytica]
MIARFQQSFSGGFNLDVDLTLPDRGITAIYGASGSGKTTLLRCIAGLQRAQSGFLSLNGLVWQDAQRFVPTHQRALGYVFQEASLFSHLDVQGNLDFARRRSRNRDQDYLKNVVAMMGIEPLLKRSTAALSGGERQRVAIARALLSQPKLLLLDEPLAALDTSRREEILPYLERLHEEFEAPVLYVSHSLDEITRLADQLVVVENGRVEANEALSIALTRTELSISQHDDAGVILEARVVERDDQWHLIRAAFTGDSLWVRDNGDSLDTALRIRVLARDVSLALEEPGASSIVNRLKAEVEAIDETADSAMALVTLKLAGENRLLARLTRRSVHSLELCVGRPVWAQVKSVAVLR